jgi:predicted ABC-type ATPase
MAIARVARRVQQGGHGIPDDVVRRRFEAGRANFERIYKSAVDDWVVYDNSGPVPVLLDWSENR